jgi:WD40 repeat protein
MSWPLSQDYNEAIQDPPSAFKDPELRGGELKLNALGLPLPHSGNFADVYEVTCPATQTKWAVKCFTREVPGLQQRYSAISRHLSQAGLHFTVDFQFLAQGIRIRSQWYPILKMRWVEGLLLNEFVRDNLDKAALLQALQQIWGRLAKRLREADIAHCDLQHGNVLLVPGRTEQSLAVKLIDYDGMWVPALAQTKSGEVGHPNYQHPQRLREGTYNREVDRFPFLVTATALRALVVAGRTLWERYDNGDNLLFKEADLRAPDESQLFHELSTVADPLLQALLAPLRQACRSRLEAAPRLEEVLPEEKTTAMQVAPPPLPPVGGLPAADWGFASQPGPQGPGASGVGLRGRGRKVARKGGEKRGGSVWAWIVGGGGLAAAVAVAAVFLLMDNVKKPNTGPQLVFNTPAATGPSPSTPVVTPPPSAGPPETHIVPPPTRSSPPNTGMAPHPPVGNPIVGEGAFHLLGNSTDLVAMTEDDPSSWQLYALQGKRAVQQFVGHKSPIVAFGSCFNGSTAITACADGMLTWWNVQVGRPYAELLWQRPVVSVSLSGDGSRSVTADGSQRVQVWDRRGGPPRELAFDLGVSAAAISVDCEKIACGSGSGLRANPIWLGKASDKALTMRLPGHVQGITYLAFSPNGQLLASGSKDKEMRLWDVETGAPLASVDALAGQPGDLQFSPDSDKLLVDCGTEVYVWSVPQKVLLTKVRRPEGARLACAFDAGSSKVIAIVAAKDQPLRRQEIVVEAKAVVEVPPGSYQGIFRMYDAATARVVITDPKRTTWLLMSSKDPTDAQRFTGHTAPIIFFSMTANGKFAATSSEDHSLRIWDVVGNRCIGELRDRPKPITAAAVSPDGKLVWYTDGGNGIVTWDMGKGTSTSHFYPMGARLTCIAFAPNGKEAAWGQLPAGSTSTSMYIWESLEDRSKNFAIRDLPSRIRCIAWSDDGKSSAIAMDGGKLRTSDGATGATSVHDAPDIGPVTGLRFSADDKKVIVTSERGFYVWDVPGGKLLHPGRVVEKGALAAGFDEGDKKVRCIELGADGRTLRGSLINLSPTKPIVVTPPPKGKPDGRFAVPSAADYAAAEADLHEQLKELYQKNSPLLGNRLWRHAIGNSGATTEGRYVALMELREMAVKQGDLFSAFRYAGEIVNRYQVNRANAVADTVEVLARAVHDAKAGQRVIDQALRCAYQARAEDNYDAALKCVRAAQSAANKVPGNAQKGHLAKLLGELNKEKAAFPRVREALDVLATSRDDPTANLEVGRFRCIQEVWEEGLPHLSKGSDAALRDLATRDLAELAKATDRKALAEAWAEQAKKENDAMQVACWRRAFAAYKQAAAALTGFDQGVVKNQMALLAQKVPDLVEPFHEMDLSEATLKNEMAYLEKGKWLMTRRHYKGGVDIMVIFRSQGSAVRLVAGAGGMVQSNSEQDGFVHVHRPDRPASELRGRIFGSEEGTKDIKLKGNYQHKFRWLLTPSGQKVWHEGRLIYESTEPCNLSTFEAVGISSPTDPLLEVKSFTVRSLGDAPVKE